MPIIDADGLFSGSRLRKCSNMARLYWPYLFQASNGYGRIELDPLRIIARAFHSFRPQPSQEELIGYIGEYADNHLLFVYEYDGQLWGQWDTDRKFLPRWPTVADKKSPSPDPEGYRLWKDKYVSEKKALPTNLREALEKLRNNFGVNIGVGVGVGVVNTTAQKAAQVTDISSVKRKPREKKRTPEIQQWLEKEFWPVYPKKVAKEDAREAAESMATTPEQRFAIIEGLLKQIPGMRLKDIQYIPNPATYLNKKRHEDETTWGSSARDPTSERKTYQPELLPLEPELPLGYFSDIEDLNVQKPAN